MKGFRSVVLALPLMCFGYAAQAAPLCSGSATVSSLGALGCTFGELTFSDFSITGSDADTTFIEIGASTLSLNILQSIPAIDLTVFPEDPADWSVSGMFDSFSFTLDYVVTATNAVLDRFQLTGSGTGGSLRGPQWGGSLTVAEGAPTLQAGSRGPFNEIGTMNPGTFMTAVSTTGGASPGLAGGNGQLGSIRQRVYHCAVGR